MGCPKRLQNPFRAAHFIFYSREYTYIKIKYGYYDPLVMVIFGKCSLHQYHLTLQF
jgi:hypothetical protein